MKRMHTIGAFMFLAVLFFSYVHIYGMVFDSHDACPHEGSVHVVCIVSMSSIASTLVEVSLLLLAVFGVFCATRSVRFVHTQPLLNPCTSRVPSLMQLLFSAGILHGKSH